ncbi:hypothetical protein PghCCS26_47340 [Paenibacillus glycanilyticus]|uniref:Uncharacterized protein n=1 Tax=Paenibacillus glycanilyticus TaxID=126569 RepID=A0ABQ6NS48_9BACL|nr:hypothetical protein [Paenibacillus glycanilyticus]GMK47604.1 hypothetical protein PghCCS26_47340 [Paenibacillus glycanilyticus]
MKRFESTVRRINRESDKAIAKFTATETKLTRQNEEIGKTIAQLDDEIAALNALRASAIYRKDANVGLIRRIGQLIRGGTV